MPVLKLKLLGGFSARTHLGEELPALSRKGQILLALLALQAGESLAREKLVTLLWGDRGENQARGSLRQELSTLRKAFSVIEPFPIQTDGKFIRIDPKAVDVDVHEFESLIRSGLASDLERAVALYRGPLLGDLAVKDSATGEWLYQERERLRNLVLEGLDRLLERRIREGSVDHAIAIAETILSHDLLREDVHRELMELYASQNRHARALKQYHLCAAALAKELSVEPEPATRKLFERIRDHRAHWQEEGEAEKHTPAPAANADPAKRRPYSGRRTRSPSEAGQLYQMGRSFFLRNLWGKHALEAARQLFTQATECDPGYARAYAGLVNCDSYRFLLGVKGVSQDVIAANAMRALALGPELAEALAAKGLSLHMFGDHKGAVPFFERAVHRNPDLFEAHYFFAHNYRALGQHEKAAEHFQRAGALNKSDYRSLGLLADEYRALGRLGESLAAARASMERIAIEVAGQPDDAYSWAFGAVILAELGDGARAEEWIEKARLIDPTDPVVNYNLGCTYAQLGQAASALQRLQAVFDSPHIDQRAMFEWMMADTSLDSLRSFQGFQDFLVKIGEQASLSQSGIASPPSVTSLQAIDRIAIAVLPFANISGHPSMDYVADGLTEDVITDLSRVSALSVISRGAAAHLSKSDNPNVQEIAKALSARFILEGSVRSSTENLSVTAKLLDGYSGVCIWAERYNYKKENIPVSALTIAQAIAATLVQTLLPGAVPSINVQQTVEPEAYREYQIGRSHLLLRGGGMTGLQIARECFQKAIEIDPTYARAYAGLATADSLRLWRGDAEMPLETILSVSDRALELDPASPEAHVAKGLALYVAGRHKEAAIPLDQAVRLGPSLFEAHIFAGRNCRALGQHAEAAAHFERAGELEPDHYRVIGLAVGAYANLGREEEMVSAARRCIERCNVELTAHPGNVDAIAFGAAVLAEAGQMEEAREWIRRAEALHPTDSVAKYNIAASYAAIGDVGKAIDCLSDVYANADFARQVHIDWLKNDSSFDSIRQHPDFIRFWQGILEESKTPPAEEDRRSAPESSVIIVPFKNLTVDRGGDLLSEDIAANIIKSLPASYHATVVSRDSAVGYYDRAIDIGVPEGEEESQYLLRGELRALDGYLWVKAELQAARTGEAVWIEEFEQEAGKAALLGEEIARRILWTRASADT